MIKYRFAFVCPLEICSYEYDGAAYLVEEVQDSPTTHQLLRIDERKGQIL